MKGIVRIDYIIANNDTPFVIEINSVPGMSKESIVPKMIKASGARIKDILSNNHNYTI